MPRFIEYLFINLFNRTISPSPQPLEGGLMLGHIVGENGVTKQPYFLPTVERAKHIAIQGKTGSGKSFLIRHIVQHDIKAGRGFLLFDFHGDLIPPTLRFLAAYGVDPGRVVIIDPTSREWAVGINPLEASDDASRFRQIAEVTRTLVERFDFSGARTEELMRYAFYVLSANNLTLVEAAPLLTNDLYRATLLKSVTNADVRDYFELRFDPLSDAMKTAVREPVLNKLTELTSDPQYRLTLGQRESTISFDEILNSNFIVLVNLNKGALGRHATTFGSLIYGKFLPTIYRRRSRSLFTVFADEMHNLVSENTNLEVVFSEARKFGVSLLTANQFSNQLPAQMRSAVQAVGTRIFFQLSPEDAEQIARDISGNKGMADKLKNLPPRHFIAKQGNHKPYEVVTPDVVTAQAPAADLYTASSNLHAQRREEVERDILARRPKTTPTKEALNDWD
jgi:DNA helicase HerA-like ATPase